MPQCYPRYYLAAVYQRVCRDGRTALHVAAASRNVEMVAILVEHQADINKVAVASSGKLSTPLDVAVTRGHRWGGDTLGHLKSPESSGLVTFFIGFNKFRTCARYIITKGGLRSSKLMNRPSMRSLLNELNTETPQERVRRQSSKVSATDRTGTGNRTTATDMEADM